MYTAIDYKSVFDNQSSTVSGMKRKFKFYTFLPGFIQAIVDAFWIGTDLQITKRKLEDQLLKSRGILATMSSGFEESGKADSSKVIDDVKEVLNNYIELKDKFDRMYVYGITKKQPIVKNLIIISEELIDNFYTIQRKLKKVNTRTSLGKTSDLAHQLSTLSTRTLERNFK